MSVGQLKGKITEVRKRGRERESLYGTHRFALSCEHSQVFAVSEFRRLVGPDYAGGVRRRPVWNTTSVLVESSRSAARGRVSRWARFLSPQSHVHPHGPVRSAPHRVLLP